MWFSRSSDFPRRQIAIISASVTSRAVMVSLIDQPTAQSENRSMTTVLRDELEPHIESRAK